MMKTHQMLPGQIHFARVNYRLCLGFHCHIIFSANQTCLILGKVFKMPRDKKKKNTLGSCNGDLFVNEKVVQPPAIVDLN